MRKLADRHGPKRKVSQDELSVPNLKMNQNSLRLQAYMSPQICFAILSSHHRLCSSKYIHICLHGGSLSRLTAVFYRIII